MGSPFAMSPPSVLTGSEPPISSAPSATSASWSPSAQKPFSARWITSAPASVSCSWITSTSSGPIPAISYAARDASTVAPTVSSIGSHGTVHLERAEPAGPHGGRAQVDRRVGVAVRVLGPAQDHRGRTFVGAAEHVLRERVVQHRRAEDLLLGERLAPEGVRVQRAVAVVLGRDLGERLVRDPVVVHVLVDLHPEELGGHELADLAVPRRARVQARIGAERAGDVLVHADRDPEVVVAEADRVGGERERARRGRAPVVDVGERDAGEPEERDDRVGVVDLVAPAERELDVAPVHARVGEGPTDRDRAHVDARHAGEAAERVQPHADDRDVRSCHRCVLSARRGGTRTSRPRCRRRRCGTAPAPAPSPCRCAARRDRDREARLHLHLACELDVPDAERDEVRARRARVRRRRRREVLGRPRPEPAAPGQQVLAHLGRRAARARVLRGKRDDPAVGAPAPDQLRLVGGPREDAFRDRDSRHHVTPFLGLPPRIPGGEIVGDAHREVGRAALAETPRHLSRASAAVAAARAAARSRCDAPPPAIATVVMRHTS